MNVKNNYHAKIKRKHEIKHTNLSDEAIDNKIEYGRN